MLEDTKPNPDELLKAVQKEEEKSRSGKLKIFFGMSAGVGKTYSMLDEAQQKIKEGVNVVIGTVNTHNRKETEALVEGIPIIPEKWIQYKELAFSELDLEAILARKPQLVLVDELAHTNVPGSKHPKRWQDVIELLDSGIDVYTTLNVQHLESRKDLVESIAGIQIRETVPDIILERATTIELVDIPPPELLQRLKEGKVYLGDQSQLAAQNFFQEDNLTALREIALRFTAEKVDHDLHGMLTKTKGWKAREKLMVAVSPSPSSQWVVRAARRLAFEQDAPWIAVFVDCGTPLSDADQTRLISHLNLARDLGAEVITTNDRDVAAALKRLAKEKEVTRIVIGRTPQKKSLFNFWEETLAERLENENKHIDVVVLREEPMTAIYRRFIPPSAYFKSPLQSYGIALVVVLALTLLGIFINPYIGYKAVGFIYLFGILILSFFVSQGPVFFGAILSALSWNFLFPEPQYSFKINDNEDLAFLITYLCTTSIMGFLTSRMRSHEQFIQKQQDKIQHLYDIQQSIANATNIQTLRINVTSRLQHLFPGTFEILIKTQDDQLIFDSQLSILQTEKEKTVATWTFMNGKPAGWSTDTLPASEGIYFPIKFLQSTTGVLVYYPNRRRPLSMEEFNFLQTVTQQLGVYISRYIYEDKVSKQEYTRQIEKLHSAIMHSLNRSFYGPVESLFETTRQLQKANLDPVAKTLCNKMERLVHNIKLTADNMITLSELDSGYVHFEKRQHQIIDLINEMLSELRIFTEKHSVEVQAPERTIYVSCDYNLMKLSLKNLIVNAIQYSLPTSPVKVFLEEQENEFRISVLDEGQNIPEDTLGLIFDKFYRSTSSKGMGIGLAVVKSVVELHQGHIEAKNLKDKGTVFTIVLPRN